MLAVKLSISSCGVHHSRLLFKLAAAFFGSTGLGEDRAPSIKTPETPPIILPRLDGNEIDDPHLVRRSMPIRCMQGL